jgi:hypothetical protein
MKLGSREKAMKEIADNRNETFQSSDWMHTT